MRSLLSPWMKYFLVYDPLPALRELSIPVLALNGEKDTQVPPTENLLPVEEGAAGGRKSGCHGGGAARAQPPVPDLRDRGYQLNMPESRRRSRPGRSRR